MSTPHLPASAGLVLRDRTNSDGQQVLVCAIYDLVAAGLWHHERPWRWPRAPSTC
ncbi:MAG TPA: hypothetical protein VNT03_12235 [Baekduia sp.]|nr:hypothetical protein [Baekduia sp.]